MREREGRSARAAPFSWAELRSHAEELRRSRGRVRPAAPARSRGMSDPVSPRSLCTQSPTACLTRRARRTRRKDERLFSAPSISPRSPRETPLEACMHGRRQNRDRNVSRWSRGSPLSRAVVLSRQCRRQKSLRDPPRSRVRPAVPRRCTSTEPAQGLTFGDTVAILLVLLCFGAVFPRGSGTPRPQDTLPRERGEVCCLWTFTGLRERVRVRG
jgi:hypothetical protein